MNYIHSPNQSNRKGYKPEFIMLHTMAGTFQGTIEWFKRVESQVSAHVLVGKKGECTQMVGDENQAWHGGVIYNPSERGKAVLKRDAYGYVNPNKYSLGIEIEAGAHQHGNAMSEEQLTKVVGVVWNWMQAYNIPVTHIITHRDVTSHKPNIDHWLSAVLDRINKLIVEQEEQKGAAENKPKKIRVKIVSNRCTWVTKEFIQPVLDWYKTAPKQSIELECDISHVSLEPEWDMMQFNTTGKFFDGYINKKWYDFNVSPYASGYDIVAFVVPEEEYKGSSHIGYATRGKSLRLQRVVVRGSRYAQDTRFRGMGNNLQFLGTLRHEISHALSDMAGKGYAGKEPVYKKGYDNTHYWDYVVEELEGNINDISYESIEGWRLDGYVVMFKHGSTWRNKDIISERPIEDKPEHEFVISGYKKSGFTTHIPFTNKR